MEGGGSEKLHGCFKPVETGSQKELMPRLSLKLEWIVPQSFRRWTNREGKI
jgi:hypothetical protein